MKKLNLQTFSWIDMTKFEMQLIAFQSSSILKQRFIDLRVDLENIEKRRLEMGVPERNADNELLRTWNAIPKMFFLKPCHRNTPHIFIYIYLLYAVMNVIKSRNRSSLTDETSSSCISLEVTTYKPNVKSLSAVMQQQKSHW